MHKKIKWDVTMTQQPQHTYFISTYENISISAHNLTVLRHSPSYHGPKTWNSIPNNSESIFLLIIRHMPMPPLLYCAQDQ